MNSISCLFDFVPKPDGPASMKEMTNAAERLPEKLIEYEGTVHQAIRNFLGVLTFHLEGPEKALECFRRVLNDDKDNINALKNCICVMEKIKKASEVKKYKTQLQYILDSADESGKQQHLSRFYAEIGFALSFDFQFGPESLAFDQRFRESISFFEKALQNGRSMEDSESSQWHFFAARSYHRLYSQCLKTKPDVYDQCLETEPDCQAMEQTEFVKRFIILFQYVIRSTTSPNYMSRAWSLLGTVFFKMPAFHKKLLTGFITQNKLERELKSPSLCFERARHLCPGSAKLVCRHARMFLTRKFSNYSRAVLLLDKSIDMDNTKFNWFALTSRATAHKREFERRDAAIKKGEEIKPLPRPLLEQAREDFERSVELKPLAWGRIDLAEVCHQLGKCTEDEEKKDRLFEEALCHFQQAVASLEGRKNYDALHLRQGRCLRDCGEVRGAIECFKMALECDGTPSHLRKYIFNELMGLMLLECRKGEVTVKEAAFWLDYATRKYGAQTQFYMEKLCQSFPAAEMFDVCIELVQTGKFEAAKLTLPKPIEGLESINSDMLTSAASSSLKFGAQLLEARNNKCKTFDFCVLYSDKEREWVSCSMIPKLEDWYKFRGFVPDRDIPIGRAITDELGQGIENSVCTVVVISPDFLEDDFLHQMLLSAFQEDDHHILLFQYKECDVPSKVSKLSRHPTICFPDWHTLNVKLDELTGVCN